MMRYSLATPMSSLVACPFCREMWKTEEARVCPECGIALTSLAKLPPSAAASDLEEEPIPAHMETLPWGYIERGRGALVAIAALGLALFFLSPWVTETAPEIRSLSGFDFALLLGWMWAPAVAWFVMIPLVASRRSIYKMRGSRVAVGFLAGIVVMTVVVRMAFVPASSTLRPVRFEWAWGLYATAALGIAASVLALRFGGSLVDVPTKQPRRGDETLH